MHISSGLCSISVCVAAAGLSVGALIASRWLDRRGSQHQHQQLLPPPVLAVLTAAVFVAQMLNVPVLGGTSGHLVGGALLGILAGPCRGLLAMIAILGTQAVLFADGGLDAIGVNVLNMGVIGVLGGWALHRAWAGTTVTSRALSAGFAAALATLAAAALCAVELGLSGTTSTSSALAAMIGAHLPIALGEGAVTGLVVALIAQPERTSVRWPVAAAVIACALTPFASTLPDGLEHTAQQLGFAGQATAYAAPLANYLVPGIPGALAVICAGIIGAVMVAALVRYTPRSA